MSFDEGRFDSITKQKDLGLAVLKTERRKFDENITITAIEQDQYFNVVFKALELLRPELAGEI